jgi:hypothetical protein
VLYVGQIIGVIENPTAHLEEDMYCVPEYTGINNYIDASFCFSQVIKQRKLLRVKADYAGTE